METTQTTTRYWHFSRSGRVIAVTDSATIDDARSTAARWNRDETRPAMRVEIVANAPRASHATSVTAVA